MALVFLYARDDFRGTYEKYDVVEILEDSQLLEIDNPASLCCLPKFLVVKIAKTKAELIHFKKPLYSENLKDENGYRLLMKKRQYQFNYDTKMTAKDLTDITKSKAFLIKEVVMSDVELK